MFVCVYVYTCKYLFSIMLYTVVKTTALVQKHYNYVVVLSALLCHIIKSELTHSYDSLY